KTKVQLDGTAGDNLVLSILDAEPTLRISPICREISAILSQQKEKRMKTNMKQMKNEAVTIIALTTVLSALALGSAFGQLASKAGTRAFEQPAPNNVTVFATGLNNPR